MSNLDESLIQETIDTWQPLSNEPLTKEDAKEIIHNIAGFFGTLIKLEMERVKREEKENKEKKQ